jgi:GDP-L-fucose synthase
MENEILVTGSGGLVGSEFENVVKINSKIDLRNPTSVDSMIKFYSPKYVIHTAGKVGGLGANMSNMGEFFYDNIMMNTNIIESCRKYEVQKLICFLSTCIFPNDVKYPLNESMINYGPPHYSNFGYAYAKRMAQTQIETYNLQYGTNYFSIIPCNIYGPNDNFNLNSSHVIPAIIHKTYLAIQKEEDLVIWGSGNPLREFIYSKDVAEISKRLLELYSGPEPIIVSTSNEVSIKKIVEIITDIMGFTGKVIFDTNKPDGQYRKPSNNSKLKSIIGDYKFTSIEEGLKETIDNFILNYNNIRK